jgi:glutamate racemase
VLEQVRRARPDAAFVYAADDAAFPYGRLTESVLIARVLTVMERLLALHAPDLVVVACNTASTLVLPALRQRFVTPFVGVVPPIKPAAAATRSRVITLLATPGTVARAYTHELIEAYAGSCEVTRPDGRRTDVVCLSCTHYPLLLARFQALAPWPVTWIDPAPAIARRVIQLLGPTDRDASDAPPVLGAFTGGAGLTDPLRLSLAVRGIGTVAVEPMPLGLQ